jgi:hypothetical protein
VSRVEIAVDGRVVGRAPVRGEVFVEPGRHWVTAVLAGHEPVAEVVELAKGSSRVVRLTVGEPLAPPSPAASLALPLGAPSDGLPGAPPAAPPLPLAGPRSASRARLPVAPPSLTEEPSAGWIVAGSVLSAGAAALGVAFVVRTIGARDHASGSLAEASASGTSFCGKVRGGAACDAHRDALDASETYGVLSGVSFGVAGTLALGTAGYALFPRSRVKPAVAGRGVTVTIEF